MSNFLFFYFILYLCLVDLYNFTFLSGHVQGYNLAWNTLNDFIICVQSCNFYFNTKKKKNDTNGGMILKAAVLDGGTEQAFAALIAEASCDLSFTLRLSSVEGCCLFLFTEEEIRTNGSYIAGDKMVSFSDWNELWRIRHLKTECVAGLRLLERAGISHRLNGHNYGLLFGRSFCLHLLGL